MRVIGHIVQDKFTVLARPHGTLFPFLPHKYSKLFLFVFDHKNQVSK